MKKILSILVIACLALVFAGCQKDGVYNPSKKISRIYYTNNAGVKSLDQIWNWNGNLLDRIDFYSSGTLDHSYNFQYDGKRLTRISNYANNRYVEYTYDGSHYSTANVFSGGSLRYTYKFTYEGGKLTGMTCNSTGKGSMEKIEINPLSVIFDADICQSIDKAEKQIYALNDGKTISTETYKFTWEKGNITQMVMNYQGGTYYYELNSKITYDNKKNPFLGGHISYYPEDDIENGNMGKNNITKIDNMIIENGQSENLVYVYDYTYNKNYPVSKRTTIIDNGQSENDGMIEVEYLK